jgi:hypothetical protein
MCANLNEIDVLDHAVAILRHYADIRKIPENEAGRISHYAMLYAQQKGISQEKAFEEIFRRFQTDSWSVAADPPQTAIYIHLIGITTDPIPELANRTRKATGTITDQEYISYIHKLVCLLLTQKGHGNLAHKVSVHPVEVRTNLPRSSDYLHIVEVAGDSDTISQIKQLWPIPPRRRS